MSTPSFEMKVDVFLMQHNTELISEINIHWIQSDVMDIRDSVVIVSRPSVVLGIPGHFILGWSGKMKDIWEMTMMNRGVTGHVTLRQISNVYED